VKRKMRVFSLLGTYVLLTGSVLAQPLKFMTFNLWGEYFGNPAAEREAGARTTILRHAPDVIAFQEADVCWWEKATFFKDLREKDLYDIVKGDMATALKDGGWAGRETKRCQVNPQPLAYNRERLELVDSGVFIFHAMMSDKGATWAVLRDRVTGFRFIAFATHFWYMWNGEESDALKETNATHLMDELRALKNKYPYPIIGGGDLNSVPGSWAHNLFEGRGLARAADCADRRDPTVTCHGDPKKGADGKWHGQRAAKEGPSLDHIFVETNGIHAITHKVVVDQEALDASDHSPVTVTFEPKRGEITALWGGRGLEKAPKAYPAPELNSNGVTAVFLDSVPWYGKPTRFFAFYSLPKGASKEKPVPGVVIVHGGGGTAFWNYVKYWNDKGYAAIAMDNCGSIPHNEPGKPGSSEHSTFWLGHAWSGPRGWENFREAYEKPEDQWPFHAVATVILSHSFLRSLPEVDASRIGITGVSWGGYLTCIAGSVDHRYRWANPVYGCGFLGDNSYWKDKLDRLGDKGRHWLALWDPSEYLPEATCPFLWVSGQHDAFYPVDSLLKSAALVKRSYYDVPENFNHGHNPGFLRPSIVDFAAAMNAGKDFPENYPAPYGEARKLASEDYTHTVRPIGVGGQPAWNGRAAWFMYPPTFGFTNRHDAAVYRFTVTDESSVDHTFVGKTANDSLAPVWARLPKDGWFSVTCEAQAADGTSLGLVGSRTFWKQAPFRPGTYAKPKLAHAEAAKRIGRYVMKLPIVQANYLAGKPVPKEMVNPDNQTFIAYPSKMGAAIIKAMAALATSDAVIRADALRLADGVVKKLAAITEPDGRPLAGFPLTYENHPGLTRHPAKILARNGGKVMMIYPCEVADAYLDLFAVTHDAALKTAALKIADKYLELQGADGTWPLNCYLKDAKEAEANRLVPVHLMEFLERVYTLTGAKKYRAAADRAFAYVEKGPLASWNWEGQFEDVIPTAPYQNLTKHNACDTAIYLVKRYPGDKKRLAQARELLRFSEDQFVCWERPYRGVADDSRGVRIWGGDSWRCPAVLEQYNCYVPIDASSAKLVQTYLALYRAEGSKLDLAKATALGDALARETKDDGYLPTFWFNFCEDWPNCMLHSAAALKALDAVENDAHNAAVALKVDFTQKLGPMKPLHQAGQPPMPLGEIGWGPKLFHYLPEAGIRYSRLHDTGGAYGGGKFVDISNLFRDFNADENDPKSYDFTFTDLLLKALVTNGIAPFFRLGETIENHAHLKRYRTFVPADKAKWARICEHVIRHYNEGWADGFRFGIEYWEIWNEPDFTTAAWNPMWTGTAEDFYDLYEVTATHLKKCFPKLKIGGYGSCGFWAITSDEKAKRDGKDERTAERKAQEEYHVSFFRNFLKRVKAKKIPFDFFTFHSYSPVDDILRQIEWCCDTMQAEGLGDVELNLDEWLPAPAHEKLATAKQAAEIAAVLAGASRTRLDMAMLYDARCGVGNYSPLFNALDYKPTYAYDVLQLYEKLYAAGTRVPVDEDRAQGLYATAAVSADGTHGWLFVANVSDKATELPRPAGKGWRCVSCRSVAWWKNGRGAVPLEDVIHPQQVLLVEYVRSAKP